MQVPDAAMQQRVDEWLRLHPSYVRYGWAGRISLRYVFFTNSSHFSQVKWVKFLRAFQCPLHLSFILDVRERKVCNAKRRIQKASEKFIMRKSWFKIRAPCWGVAAWAVRIRHNSKKKQSQHGVRRRQKQKMRKSLKFNEKQMEVLKQKDQEC